VNSVLPGPTASEGVETFVRRMAEARGTDFKTMEREFFATARPSSLLKRFATPQEVASMIVYVCSAPASATNGAALRVDGGWFAPSSDQVEVSSQSVRRQPGVSVSALQTQHVLALR